PDIVVSRSATDQTANFTVTLNSAANVPVSIDYSTGDGTAVAGTDYDATNGVLTFPAGTTSETIPVTVLGSTNTGDKSFNLNVNVDPDSVADVTLANTVATATIADTVEATLSPLT